MGLFHPRHRDLPLLLLNFTMFLSAHSSSLLRFFPGSPALQHASCIPQTSGIRNLQRTHPCQPITQAVDEDDEQHQPQCQTPRNIRLLPIQLPVISYYCTSRPYLLSEVMQIFFQSMSKGLLNLKQTSTALHLSTEPAISPQKEFRLFKHKFLSVNPSWLPRVQSSLRISQLL